MRAINAHFSHLNALQAGLMHERERLRRAKSPHEIKLRTVWVKQYEREIADERKRLGLAPESQLPTMSDDEILAALTDS